MKDPFKGYENNQSTIRTTSHSISNLFLLADETERTEPTTTGAQNRDLLQR